VLAPARRTAAGRGEVRTFHRVPSYDQVEVELVLINGERRVFVLSGHTGSVVAVLDRLDDWVQVADGGWVQKTHIVEVRIAEAETAESPPARAEE
jgi:hypothetical protein